MKLISLCYIMFLLEGIQVKNSDWENSFATVRIHYAI